jgi:hypothetical protein
MPFRGSSCHPEGASAHPKGTNLANGDQDRILGYEKNSHNTQIDSKKNKQGCMFYEPVENDSVLHIRLIPHFSSAA